MPKDYINILFISGFSLSFTVSHLSLCLSLSLTHFPLFLPLLYHLSISPSYHCHSPYSRFTLQSMKLHRDHQPSLKPISKLQIGEIGVVARLSWRLAWWVSRSVRSAMVGFWVRHFDCCQPGQWWGLISWWVSLLSTRSALWVFFFFLSLSLSWWFL